MAIPKTAVQRFDLSMSYAEFSNEANRQGFVGLRVLPAVGVAQQSANFPRLEIASVLTKVEDTLRKPKTAYSQGDFKWVQDSYATDDHGAEETMDDRLLAIYGKEIDAEMIHRDRAINRVLMAYENDVAQAVFNTTTWTGAALTTAVATPWSTPATATPITDIDNAIEKVKLSSGQRPNSLVITDYALRKLCRCAQITDLIKFSGRDDPKSPTNMEALAGLFLLDQIIIADGFKNTASDGLAASLSRLWDISRAMVCHIDRGRPDLSSIKPTLGKTIMWTEENAALPGAESDGPNLIIEEYREEGVRGSKLRARCDRVIKILHKEAGHLLTNVAA